jgi:hypothetical protein
VIGSLESFDKLIKILLTRESVARFGFGSASESYPS